MLVIGVKNFVCEKLLLYKIKQILVNEMQNPYYKNASNVCEVIDLGTERIDRFTIKYHTIDYVRNMCIYRNGYVQFNSFIRTINHLPDVSQPKYQKMYQKNN